LGAFLRRLKSRLGMPKAVTATAHKLVPPVSINNACQCLFRQSDF